MTVRVDGLRALATACAETDDALRVETKDALQAVAEVVADESRNLMGGATTSVGTPIDFGGKTIEGISARVTGIYAARVMQQRRKSSVSARRRPNFGAMQQKILEQAVADKQEEIQEAADKEIGRLIHDYWEG